VHPVHLLNALLAESLQNSQCVLPSVSVFLLDTSPSSELKIEFFCALYALAQCPPGRASTEPLVIMLSLCLPLHSLTSKVFNNLEASSFESMTSAGVPSWTQLYPNSTEFRSAFYALAFRDRSTLSCTLLHEATKNQNLKSKNPHIGTSIYPCKCTSNIHLQHIINTWRHSSTYTE
jgi:hypothetical protein